MAKGIGALNLILLPKGRWREVRGPDERRDERGFWGSGVSVGGFDGAGIVKGRALNEVFFLHSFADTKEWRKISRIPNKSLHNISYVIMHSIKPLKPK